MKSWTEKLNAPARAEVKPAPVSIAGMRAGEIMLVPLSARRSWPSNGLAKGWKTER